MAITLRQASDVVDATLAAVDPSARAPLTVVVLDPGGHLVAAKREDSSGILRFEIAFAKAWGALGMGRPTRALADQASELPAFSASLSAVSGGRVVPVPGGVLITDAQGVLVGAVGVSGDTSDVDERCAIAGVTHVGLVPVAAEGEG